MFSNRQYSQRFYPVGSSETQRRQFGRQWIVLIALAGILLTARAASAENCKAQIFGTVTDENTGARLSDVGVHSSGVQSVQTDAKGRFKLKGLCPGDIILVFDHEVHEPHIETVHVDTVAKLQVKLSPGETIIVYGRANKPAFLGASTKIEKEDLAKTQGQDFGETLEYVPGVALLRTSSGVPKPIIRGQSGRRLVTLVDGMRHESQKWGNDHAPEIDPFIAHSIKVLRGAAAVRYGPDAQGGAIEVETTPLLTQSGLAGTLQLAGFTNGLGGAGAGRILWASKRVKGLAAMIEGSAKKHAGLKSPRYPLDNTGGQEINGGATIGFRTNAFTSELSYRHYQATLGNCLCIRNESYDDFLAQQTLGQPNGIERYRADFEIERPKQQVAHDTVLLRTSGRIKDAGDLSVSYNFQQNRRKEFDIVRSDTKVPQFDFRLRTHIAKAEFDFNSLDFGDKYHLHSSIGATGSFQKNARGGLPLTPNHESLSAGVFAIERLTGPKTEFELGLRYDFLDRDASMPKRDFDRLVRGGLLNEDTCQSDGEMSTATTTCKSRFHAFSATAGGLWAATREFTAKASASIASRIPNPDEQFLDGTAPSFPVLGIGLPSLGIERTYGGVLSFAYNREKFAAEASFFGNYIDDYIYFAPAIGEDGLPVFDVLIRGTVPRFETRPVDAVFYGAEAGFLYRPWEFLEIHGQLSLVQARDVQNNAYLVFVPPNRAQGEVAYRFPEVLGFWDGKLSVQTTLVARQGRTDPNADLAPAPPGYALLGAEVSAQKLVAGNAARFSVIGKNLLNTRYRDYTNLLRYFADEPGYELMFKMSMDFGDI